MTLRCMEKPRWCRCAVKFELNHNHVRRPGSPALCLACMSRFISCLVDPYHAVQEGTNICGAHTLFCEVVDREHLANGVTRESTRAFQKYGEFNMNMRFSNFIGRQFALATIVAGALCSFSVAAQQEVAATAKQLEGLWSLMSLETMAPDGTKKPGNVGLSPKGLFIFDRSGRYSNQIFQANLPTFASNNKQTGTTEENKAVVQGMLSHFGTYKVNEKDGTFTVLPEASSFPNWTGVEQPARKFAIAGDTLTIINPSTTSGSGTNVLTLKRIR